MFLLQDISMSNPAGDYPGMQIFVGTLGSGEPAFAYFISGRAKESQERYASHARGQSVVKIKPLNPRKLFDKFRHYNAVKIDSETGTLVVGNNEGPINLALEYFSHMKDKKEAMENLQRMLGSSGPEQDGKSTPRILGVIRPDSKDKPDYGVSLLAITDRSNYATVKDFPRKLGEFHWVSTFNGDVEYRNFNAYDLGDQKHVIDTDANGSKELADEIFKMSDYVDGKYGELRVCAIAGVRTRKGPGGWDIAVRNRHKV